MEVPQAPPPAYEPQIANSNGGHSETQFKIARKPIGAKQSRSNLRDGCASRRPSDAASINVERLKTLKVNDTPPLPPRPGLKLETALPAPLPSPQLPLGPNSTNTSTRSPISSYFASNASSAITPSSGVSPSATFAKKAYQEVRHFAGGLIQHPFESTKHFSILRHSHGLVFYQGVNTTLAVSIFADAPLPADRTIWLQSKGWSGNTGMRLKAFVGSNGSWRNVTPTTGIRADQLKPSDERAWQRDINNFKRKKTTGRRENHTLRETAVVRIPAEAGDGYFQLVLCRGEKKKVLCPSPVFRVLSTSTSPHSMRGASLSTLPLEFGAMALNAYVRNTAGRLVTPVASVVQNRVQAYMPSFWVQEAAITAYDKSGAADRISSTAGDVSSRYEEARAKFFAMVAEPGISPEEGPRAPYPLIFQAPIDPAGYALEMSNLPTLVLSSVHDRLTSKLDGYYLGWVRYVANKQISEIQDWLPAVVSSLPIDTSQLSAVNIKEASRKIVSIHLIRDSAREAYINSAMEVMVLGFIRSDEPEQRVRLQQGLQAGDDAALEAAMLTEFDDVSRAQSILDHPAWGPEAASGEEKVGLPWNLERVKTGIVETRLAAQKQIERVPFHKAGIRTPMDQWNEQSVALRGFYVVR